MPADLILTNANIHTLDPLKPQASTLAIRDQRVLALDEPAMRSLGPQTRVVDLQGRTVLPGFHDCHMHLLWFAVQRLTHADLIGCESVDEILGRLAEQARRVDGWIIGHGFDQSKLRERRFPTRAELDSVSPNRPVLISRVCAHACVVNSAAIAAASQVKPEKADDPNAGLFTESRVAQFHRAVPPPDAETLERAAIEAMNVALDSGITALQTLLDRPEQMLVYATLKRKLGRLPLRIEGIYPQAACDELARHGIITGVGDEWLSVGGAKFFADGSLGARTALLAQPYADDPTTTGQRIYNPQDLRTRCVNVSRSGFDLAIHAIGDQALREAIDAIEAAIADHPDQPRKHRIEHASVCPPELLERMIKSDIGATLQPQFVTSDTWTADRLGPLRSKHAYPFQTMLNAGLRAGLSSDCPVERLDSAACLHAAVNRHPWSPHEKLTIPQAIQAYTRGSARLGGLDRRLGTLAPGMLADFNVFNSDPFKLSPADIRSLKPAQTYVAGTPHQAT